MATIERLGLKDLPEWIEKNPEPLPAGHALYTHARVRLTPHISWAAGDVGATSTHKFLDNLKRYLDARPLRDVVEPARGY